MPNTGHHPDAPFDAVRKRIVLARKWAYLFSRVVVISLDREELDHELHDQLDSLCEALHDETFDARPVELLGERLVAMGYVGEPGLRCTMDVLGKGLLALPEFRPVERFAERITAALTALACGFTVANQRDILEQQESMQLSLIKAVRDAKWHLKESEARFDEVVTSSASGIMVIGLDGRLMRANAAIGDILGQSPAELTGTTLFDLVHPDSADILRDAMRALLDGREDRVRQSQRLLRKNGEVVRISLTASLLRGADELPSSLVVVVEDGTELMLLQSELKRQALHDVLTGLPNRQFFGSHLESVLRRADPVHGVTLFHLDLDAFGMICDSLGRNAGEQVLVHVSQRLKAVMARERAMIARFDGDEFAILVENSSTTPDIATTVANINAELAEPTYVGGRGLAVSVSAGVVHHPAPDLDPAELLRAADSALRRAKAGRRGQWELFHPDSDADDRRTQALAVGMPGAWEQGEIAVVYRPAFHLADGRFAGVEALLRWDHPELGTLPHDRCAELAERTGLVLPLGEWLLRISSGQVEWWRQQIGFDRVVAVALTAHQACDADLVSRVVRALDDTGLRPGQLVVGMPVGALSVNEAVDNLTVLTDTGVRTALDDIDLGPDDLAAVEDLPVSFVRVARRIVERQARSGSTVVGTMLPLFQLAGAAVVVDGIDTAEQADWWRRAGADLATGDFFGGAAAPGDVVDHFSTR